MRLDDFLAEEKELSEALIVLEGIRKELIAKRREIVSAFTVEKRQLEELQAEVERHRKKVLELHAQYEECAEQIKELSGDIRANSELLEEVRNNIAELRRVTVFVYSSGNIELEHAQMPQISDGKVTAEFERLISLTEAEELTVKGVRGIAKLRVMMRELPSDAELVFDSPELQTLYSA